MWESIQSAQGYVWISTFILEDDLIGRRTIKELSDAAARGVRYNLCLFLKLNYYIRPDYFPFFFFPARGARS